LERDTRNGEQLSPCELSRIILTQGPLLILYQSLRHFSPPAAKAEKLLMGCKKLSVRNQSVDAIASKNMIGRSWPI